ncbi:GD13092 [Drosophila simulans]|uniref:GD13092 n=1 Tax=Drosophila simulans TaxID=7240 RepID=B4QJX1_DROSI|nr:GD13092 [Drosophila simulans]
MASSSSGANHKPPPVPPRPVNLPRPSMLQSEGQSESQISSRCRYIVLVYLLVVVILLLALVQWELVCYYKSLTDIFLAKYWISVSCMLISAPLLAIFLLIRQVRYFPILGWLLMCSIVELMVIGVCTLAAYCHALTFLIYFTITAILVIVLVLIGSFIPCDLTANVASLFIFIMYHAQLISGWRYAELYITDGLFAVIVLFCHFCIILMLFCFLDWPQIDDVDDTDSSEFAYWALWPLVSSAVIEDDFLGQTTQDFGRLLSPLVDIIITSIILDHTQMTTTAKK